MEPIKEEPIKEEPIKEEEINNSLLDIKEPYTLKAKGGNATDSHQPTDPVGLSRSILHVLHENTEGYCKVLSVGPIAMNIVMSAFRLAATSYSARTKGTVLVVTQSEYTAIVAGNKTRGVCTRIFPIPVAYQL